MPYSICRWYAGPGPEVDQDQPNAVEGVEQDTRDQADLHQADDRVLRLMISEYLFRVIMDDRGIENVNETGRKIVT